LKNIIFVISFLLISFFTYSQKSKKSSFNASDERVPLSNFLIKSSFRLPNMTSNVFLKEKTSGVADISLSGNYSFYKRLYLGIGYRYSNFQISDKKLRSNTSNLLNSEIHFHGVYGEVSYIFSLGETFSIEASMQAGQNNIVLTSSLIAESVKKTGLFYSPNINLYLRGEEELSFNVTIGYTITNNDFKPQDVGKTSFKDYTSIHYNNNYQYINVGFGISYSFLSK